jgi:hypothetical protein
MLMYWLLLVVVLEALAEAKMAEAAAALAVLLCIQVII